MYLSYNKTEMNIFL